jgi:hypothetical protein
MCTRKPSAASKQSVKDQTSFKEVTANWANQRPYRIVRGYQLVNAIEETLDVFSKINLMRAQSSLRYIENRAIGFSQ